MSFDPTPEARDLFATLDERWSALLAWGVEASVPQAHLQVADWKAYRQAWSDQREQYAPPDLGAWIMTIPALGTEANQLASVEKEAATKGYVPPSAVIPGSAIDVTQTTETGQSAQQVQEQAQAVADAAKAAEEHVGSLWASIPWYWKLGAVAVGAGIVVGAVRR